MNLDGMREEETMEIIDFGEHLVAKENAGDDGERLEENVVN